MLIPLKQLKACIDAVPAAELPIILAQVVRLCLQKAAFPGRKLADVVAGLESDQKGL